MGLSALVKHIQRKIKATIAEKIKEKVFTSTSITLNCIHRYFLLPPIVGNAIPIIATIWPKVSGSVFPVFFNSCLYTKLRSNFPVSKTMASTITENRHGKNKWIYSCYISHSVWKCIKMSHMNFSIWAFSSIFCSIKGDMSGNTVWPQASGFQKLAKLDHFWHF